MMFRLWLESAVALRVAGFVFLVVLIVLGIMFAAGNFDLSGLPPATISISGEGMASSSPDIATLQIGVDKDAPTLAAAQAAATTAMNAALSYLKSAGVLSADIQTTNYNISPNYSYPSNPVVIPVACNPGGDCGSSGPITTTGTTRTLVGYEVSQSASVTIHDLANVGTILQGLATAGITNVSGPDFSIENPDAITDVARQNAINDAQTKAKTLAAELHVRLGKIVSYQENSGGGIMPLYAAAVSSVSSAVPPPQVPTGTTETTVDVTITYEIH